MSSGSIGLYLNYAASVAPSNKRVSRHECIPLAPNDSRVARDVVTRMSIPFFRSIRMQKHDVFESFLAATKQREAVL